MSARLAEAESLRTALEEDRFVLYGQPILYLRENAVGQQEVLLRLRDEEGGEPARRRELRHHAAAARLTIDVTSAGLVLTKALRGEVRRRVLLAMSRFGPEVHGVKARLAAAHNPLGGVDQRCRVRARLQSGLVLRAEAMNGLIEMAIGRSVTHLALLVAEALDGTGGRHPSAPRLRRRGSGE